MDYLQHGIEVRYLVKGEERSGLVYLVDYNNPSKNSFVVANQWTFVENSNKRPDVLLFQGRNRCIRSVYTNTKLHARDTINVYL